MIIINTVSTSKFSVDGLEYYKNFMPIARGNTISIINAYDSKIDLSGAKVYDQFNVNGTIYGTLELAQSALLPVLFSRDAGGVGGFIWGEGTGDITNQTDLMNYIANNAGTLQAVITGGNTYVDGDNTWTWDGDKLYSINTEDDWGLILSSEEGLVFTDGTGSSIGKNKILQNGFEIGNGVNAAAIVATNITNTRVLQIPDKSGIIALKIEGFTVATLPTGELGATNYVTDATAITYRATATGGGTGKALVFFDGTNWIYH